MAARATDGGDAREGAAAIGPATASVRFVRSNKAAPLPPDKSVLEVAESIGVPIDYSCRVGTCGVCKTHLLEGDVTMEVQDALTDDDKAEEKLKEASRRKDGKECHAAMPAWMNIDKHLLCSFWLDE